MRTKIKAWMAVWIILAMINIPSEVHAALSGSLLQTSVVDEGANVTAYIRCDGEADSAEMQIAQYPCEDVHMVIPGNISVHTVIMVDNSLSVTTGNRENIKKFLRQYVQGISEQEVVSLAVFGEEIQFLAVRSQDKEEILQLIDEIEFHNQDTYLTDFLYEQLEKIREDSDFTRFVIISDGVDNKAIGITKEELLDKLEEISRPVYAVGHIYKDNDTELKNMFALPRITGGQAFMIEDYEDTGAMADEIHDFSHLYAVTAKIPQEAMDGGKKDILLKLHCSEGELEMTGEVRMPFGKASQEEEKESLTVEVVPLPVPQLKEEIKSQTDKQMQPEEPEPIQRKKSVIGVDKIVWIAILVIAVILLVVYQKKNKTVQKSNSKKKNKKGKKNIVIPPQTVMPEPQPVQQESETVFLDGRYLLALRDRMNPDRIFRYPLDGHVIVGRNVDMAQIAIDYNRTISKRHCEFYVRNNHFFIRDMNSSNHTYLNGEEINGEREILSGSIVRLGEAEFSVEIMPI